MVIKTLTCNFSQDKIYPGHGKQYVRLDAKVPRPPANPQFLCRRNPPERVAFSLRRCLPTSCARGLRPTCARSPVPPACLPACLLLLAGARWCWRGPGGGAYVKQKGDRMFVQP